MIVFGGGHGHHGPSRPMSARGAKILLTIMGAMFLLFGAICFFSSLGGSNGTYLPIEADVLYNTRQHDGFFYTTYEI